MGYKLVCDECGKGLDELDRTHVARDSLEGGSVRLDLCDACAAPVLKVGVVDKKVKEMKAKVKAMTDMAQTSTGTVPVIGASN